MYKFIVLVMFMVSTLLGAVNFQTATKEELMSIKGIGAKKAEAIIEYRKSNKISNADDLKNIKGFADTLIEKIKQNNK